MTSTKRILIVEDEPLISMVLEDFLDALDHQVAGTADCVAAALAQIDDGAAPDAAILDVNLRDGEQSWPVAEALAERSIPFILATGGPGDSVPEQWRDRPVLAKPFTIDSVGKALDSLG